MDDLRPLVLISSLATGGAERVTVSFLRKVADLRRGVPLCTLTRRRDGGLADEVAEAGLERFDLGARRLADPIALARLVRLLVSERFHVVHAHGQDAWILATAARALRRFPLVLTRHVLTEPSDGPRSALRTRCSLGAARRAEALVAVSVATAERLSELAGIAKERIHVIPNGIDIERFDCVGYRERAELRRSLNIGHAESMILVPAVLREGKGHEVLLDALPRIQGRHPGARIVFAGAGERKEALEAWAAPFGESVRFLGQREDIPELLAACDLVAHPSWEEALPTALIEASAASRPIVATRVGGTDEVVVDGVTGVLVPAGDAIRLADEIAHLLSDSARADRLGRAARKRVRERFSLDAQVDRTLALWSSVASRFAR